MTRQTIMISILMAAITFVVGLCIYFRLGAINGHDSLCLAGIVSGSLIGFWYGKKKGLKIVLPMAYSSLIISLPLVALSYHLSNIFDDLVVSIAPLGIGFSMLIFYIFGCALGKHLAR